MPDDTDLLSAQRRQLPLARYHHSARQGDQRRAAGAAAELDVVPEDRDRHGVQGAGAGDPRAYHRGPSCRSRHRQVNGITPQGNFFVTHLGPVGGGWGAKSSEDGVSVTVCINDGDTHNTPSEQVEAKYPLLIERYELRPDSGGAGSTRGGLGADYAVTALCPMKLNRRSSGNSARPGASTTGGPATAIRSRCASTAIGRTVPPTPS